jgi:hypothetical protein
MITPVLIPMLVLILWTFGVGYLAGLRRVREIRTRRIPLAAVARPRDMATALEDTQAMDNFNNLLQVPLLFYVWCLVMLQLQITAWPLDLGAWTYVGLRLWHSVIQITHNRVVQRFRVWACSHTVLTVLWVALGFQFL